MDSTIRSEVRMHHGDLVVQFLYEPVSGLLVFDVIDETH